MHTLEVARDLMTVIIRAGPTLLAWQIQFE